MIVGNKFHIDVMDIRYVDLQNALHGYEKSGKLLVAYLDNSHQFSYAGLGDDRGIYALIPKIAVLFNLHLHQAIILFFFGFLAISLLLGVLGGTLLLQRRSSKIMFTAGCMAVALLSYIISDVYIFMFVSVFSIIPLFLYFIQEQKNIVLFCVFLFFAGIFAELCQYIRSFSGMPAIIFVIVLLLLHQRLSNKDKMLLNFSFALGLMIPVLYFNHLFTESSIFLKQHNPQLNAEQFPAKHSFWHSAYISLGYFKNPYGISYLDEVAFKKAQDIDKNVKLLSKDYDRILKNVTLNFIASHPKYVCKITLKKIFYSFKLLFCTKTRPCLLTTLINKLTTLIMLSFIAYFIKNYKLIYRPQNKALHLAFLSAILTALLPGVLVCPFVKYMVGFIVLVHLYAFTFIGLTQDLKLKLPYLKFGSYTHKRRSNLA